MNSIEEPMNHEIAKRGAVDVFEIADLLAPLRFMRAGGGHKVEGAAGEEGGDGALDGGEQGAGKPGAGLGGGDGDGEVVVGGGLEARVEEQGVVGGGRELEAELLEGGGELDLRSSPVFLLVVCGILRHCGGGMGLQIGAGQGFQARCGGLVPPAAGQKPPQS